MLNHKRYLLAKFNNTLIKSKLAAFTLIELIIVVLIISILGAFAVTRFSGSEGFQARSAAATIISTARYAQQLAMNDRSRVITLAIGQDSVGIFADGSALRQTANGQDYPIDFSDDFNFDITISPPGRITFDQLGNTNPVTLTVTGVESTQVCIESTGFVHEC